MAEYNDFAKYGSNPNVLGYSTGLRKQIKLPTKYTEPQAPFKYMSQEESYM